MSYFDTKIEENRKCSVFGNNKSFKSSNEELAFAKEYNKKIYFPEQSQQKHIDNNRESTFNDQTHIALLKSNLQNNKLNKQNSANYRQECPITNIGKPEITNKYSSKRNLYSNVDNIRDAGACRDLAWKSTSKKVNVDHLKQSVNEEEQFKRKLKQSPLYDSLHANRNPLFGGEGGKPIISRVSAGDQKVSELYKKQLESKFLLPADRRYAEQAENPFAKQKVSTSQVYNKTKCAGEQAKETLSYKNGPQYRDTPLTWKENSYVPDQRKFSYQDNNQTDYRKTRSNFQRSQNWYD